MGANASAKPFRLTQTFLDWWEQRFGKPDRETLAQELELEAVVAADPPFVVRGDGSTQVYEHTGEPGVFLFVVEDVHCRAVTGARFYTRARPPVAARPAAPADPITALGLPPTVEPPAGLAARDRLTWAKGELLKVQHARSRAKLADQFGPTVSAALQKRELELATIKRAAGEEVYRLSEKVREAARASRLESEDREVQRVVAYLTRMAAGEAVPAAADSLRRAAADLVMGKHRPPAHWPGGRPAEVA